MLSKQEITRVLAKFIAPEKISGIVINGGHVGFALLAHDEVLRKACEREVFALPGVEKVTAVLTGERGEIKTDSKTSGNKNAAMLDRRQAVAGVKKIILIASGKGGVGKSTIAVNLAVAVASLGNRIGLLDADIYGPSVPRMLGLTQISGVKKPEITEGKMLPFNSHGLVCNSVGFLIADNDAAIWRGPMATKALHQLMIGTAWNISGDLDYLFIDMPPGTGDIQLSLAQNYKIDGAVLVSTPQEIAISDVRRAAQMFRRTNIPLLGLIQNMSFFEDSNGSKQYIFGEDGGRKFAEENDIPFLGEIPLLPTLRQNSDSGVVQPGDEFFNIAKKIIN